MSLTSPDPSRPELRRIRKLHKIIAGLLALVCGLIAGIFAYGVGGQTFYNSVGVGAAVLAAVFPLVLLALGDSGNP